jgi:putative protease
MKKPELLAPAGSMEALIAAIGNGADAVYFGGRAFSARHDAALDDVEWAIDYAHTRGVKAYVTVNSLIKDSELEKASEYLQFLCNAGADAVIVQDLGILKLIREQLPELPVHASTQMTIHNTEGVEFLKELGVKRVVLARELTLDEIKQIKSETGIEIETFIHGALCFSYSGQCLFSSMIGGRSGNRGYCAQPCRKRYKINEAEGHLLSPKDLNMSEHIGTLMEAGIDSFKIEGRLKRPEYVAGVVRVYRKLIERYLEKPSAFCVTDDEKHTLLQLFNREFTAGYFFGNPGDSLMSREQAHNQGTYLGKVVEYDRNAAYIHLGEPLSTGDGIGTQGRGAGVTVRSMYIDNTRVDRAPPGSTVRIPMETYLHKNEIIYKTYDSMLMDSLVTKEIIAKIPITMSFTAKTWEPVALSITDGKNEVTLSGGIPAKSKGSPASNEAITRQLEKLGNSIYEAKEIRVELDDDVFIPISQLNSLRRDAVKKLEGEHTASWKRTCTKPVLTADRREGRTKTLLSVNTCTLETFEAAVDSGADVVYFGGEVWNHKLSKEELSYAVEYGKEKGVEVYIGAPKIAKEFKELDIIDPDGFLAANPGALYHLRNSGNNKQVIIDYPFNIYNRLTMSHLLDYSQRVTLSPELTLDEIKQITPYGEAECIVHGYFPLITSEHDLLGNLFPGEGVREAVLKDEKGFGFPVRTGTEGRTYIMNSRELCMLEHVQKIIEAGVSCLRIEAKMYNKYNTAKFTKQYRKAIDNSADGSCRGNYTTGHYFRGVL